MTEENNMPPPLPGEPAPEPVAEPAPAPAPAPEPAKEELVYPKPLGEFRKEVADATNYHTTIITELQANPAPMPSAEEIAAAMPPAAPAEINLPIEVIYGPGAEDAKLKVYLVKNKFGNLDVAFAVE